MHKLIVLNVMIMDDYYNNIVWSFYHHSTEVTITCTISVYSLSLYI